MQTTFDAVIVGAGPAGSSAAILLARAGWSVALVEKQRFPRRKVCGECIAASNLPLIEALGIGEAFAAAAGPELREVALMRAARTVVSPLPAASDARHRWGRALGRETLDTLLLAQALTAGASVLQPWSVQAIEGAAGDYRLTLRAIDSGAPLGLRTPIVIVAHGSWEPLPSGRSSRRAARAVGDLFAFKANFIGASLAEGLLPVLSFDGGYGGMVVADAGVTTLACCIRRDRLDDCRRAAPAVRLGEAVQAWLARECCGVRDALRTARRDGPWLAAGPLAPGIHLNAGSDLLRIGNAAGEAHPIIGEGMSMALQSAWLLCAQLVGPGPRGSPGNATWHRAVARRYADEWRRAFTPRLRLAAAFAHLAMRPAAADALMALVQRWPGLLMRGASGCGKTRSAVDAATMARLTLGASPALESGARAGVASRLT